MKIMEWEKHFEGLPKDKQDAILDALITLKNDAAFEQNYGHDIHVLFYTFLGVQAQQEIDTTIRRGLFGIGV